MGPWDQSRFYHFLIVPEDECEILPFLLLVIGQSVV